MLRLRAVNIQHTAQSGESTAVRHKALLRPKVLYDQSTNQIKAPVSCSVTITHM